MREPGVFSPEIQRFAPVSGASPAVSVVMTACNDLRFLEESVKAVLNQTFTDFEFIIVDNGSEEPERFIRLGQVDPRLRVLRLEDNLGATGGGNFGIAASRAPIVARMDCDDIAEPGWLAAVMQALDADDELGLVGTWANLMTEHGDPIGTFEAPESDFAIRFTMLSHNPFIHSSTAYRRTLYDQVDGSKAHSPPLYELGLWRAMLPHCRARSLPQPLVRYRYNPRGVTAAWARGESRSRSRAMRQALWDELGLEFPLNDLDLEECLDDFLRGYPCRTPALWPELRRIVETAIAATEARQGRFMRSGESAERDKFVAGLFAQLERGPRSSPNSLVRLINALRLRGPRRTFAAIARKLAGLV